MSAPSKSSSILIIGAGTWGTSAALTLARRGHTNVTVLDAHPHPSPIAAGNDVNKIVEEGDDEPLDSERDDAKYAQDRMQQIARRYWKTDPLFKPFYHATGIIYCAITDEVYEHVKGYTKGHEEKYAEVRGKKAFHKTMPEGVLTGEFPGWRGLWRKDGAGWVYAKGALLAAHDEAERLGVKFVAGDRVGNVTALLYSQHGKQIEGAKTADGREHRADWTVLAAGAGADLIFDFEDQLRPTAWTLAHIKLTEDEDRLYKNLPVLFNAERGFFMEPDEKRELKFCDEHPGYLNMVRDDKHHGRHEHSEPIARQQIPLESERRMRSLLRDIMPHFADRDFCFARICWDADTVDRQFLIDRHPKYENLIIAAGGSGNGFMMMPCVGQLIVETLEGSIEDRLHTALRWRPEQGRDRNWHDTQGRFGGSGKLTDLRDVSGWTDGREHHEPTTEKGGRCAIQ